MNSHVCFTKLRRLLAFHHTYIIRGLFFLHWNILRKVHDILLFHRHLFQCDRWRYIIKYLRGHFTPEKMNKNSSVSPITQSVLKVSLNLPPKCSFYSWPEFCRLYYSSYYFFQTILLPITVFDFYNVSPNSKGGIVKFILCYWNLKTV